MSMTDPLGDMLTSLRNGGMANKETVTVPASSLRASVLDVLKREGYIRGYERVNVRKNIDEFKVELKYYDNQPVIKEIQRVSTPGRRVYSKVKDLPKFYNGLGIYVLSTPSGVMSDHEARQANLGGEVLCKVF